MEPKKKRAYTKPTLKPKPTPVHLLPPTHMRHGVMGFMTKCPACGVAHDFGPIRQLRDGKPHKMPSCCVPMLDGVSASKIDWSPKEYKLAGPIPPKHRALYLGSLCSALDVAVTNTERRKAKALNRRVEKRRRKIAIERRAAPKAAAARG